MDGNAPGPRAANRSTHQSAASRTLRFADTGIRVRTQSPADLDWLVQFLRPAFRSRRFGEADWTVDVEADPEGWERARRRGPVPSGRARECFFQDQSIVRLPVWQGGPGRLALRSPQDDSFISIDAEQRIIRIVQQAPDRIARLTSMRVVRELVQNRSWGPESMFLHGAGIAHGNRGALLVGPKRAGKTSLLLHTLRGGLFDYVANDRALCVRQGQRFRMRAFPTIVQLRISSLGRFPDLLDELRASPYFPVLNRTETARRLLGSARPWKAGTYTMSPWQLVSLTQSRPRAEVDLSAILFPDVSGTAGRIRVQRLRRPDARKIVAKGVFRANSKRRAGGAFWDERTGRPPAPDDVAAFLDSLAAEVPCYRIVLGLDAYRSTGWTERLRKLLEPG
jgi:hypothetical protein